MFVADSIRGETLHCLQRLSCVVVEESAVYPASDDFLSAFVFFGKPPVESLHHRALLEHIHQFLGELSLTFFRYGIQVGVFVSLFCPFVVVVRIVEGSLYNHDVLLRKFNCE